MNYDESSPTVLKFLVSNGDLIDEAGNVIAHSDSLADMYVKASPQVKKYLLSDGSVVDEDGNLIIKNDYFKKVYDQAEPKMAKYLHADGTIDENPGSGSGANLQDNKQVSINQNGEVEITPDNGYDGMKKVTAEVNVSGSEEINFFTKKIDGFLLYEEDYPDVKYPYIAVNNDGTLVSSVENIPNAIFLIPMNHSGASTMICRIDDNSEIPNCDVDVMYIDNQNFTITDGKITLYLGECVIQKSELYLHDCMMTSGS